ncbi:MAG: DNA polymerase III subunit delta' [Thermincola sp.]|jgi:DNA polymerase-3 subunit delta'|nr:DNA polymerase III subunit delta' [Thermincola sp.]MDT3702067.1 DNA polymerase III subunit delta' [Thermincola sp.]
MLLNEVIGHAQAKRVLQNALGDSRVAHAYLFHGPAGVGKKTLAKAFAGALLCEAAVKDSCGGCSVCRRMADEQLPDFYVLNPAGSNIKVEQIRDLQKKAQLKPYEAARKVYLINQAETMTTEAANCLLKVLEEPPKETVFLLTTVNQYSLLPTIISRCQAIPLSRLPAAEIGEMLVSKCGVKPEEAFLYASLADGLPGAAWELAVSGGGKEIREQVFKIDEQIAAGSVQALFKTAEEFEKKKDSLPQILEQLLLWYRDKLVWLQTNEEKLIINIDKISELKNNSVSLSKNYLVSSIDSILEAKNQINRNVNPRLVLEVLLLKLAKTV